MTGLAVQLGVLFLLVQPFGYEGAALAQLSTLVVSQILLAHAVRQEMRRPALASAGPARRPIDPNRTEITEYNKVVS